MCVAVEVAAAVVNMTTTVAAAARLLLLVVVLGCALHSVQGHRHEPHAARSGAHAAAHSAAAAAHNGGGAPSGSSTPVAAEEVAVVALVVTLGSRSGAMHTRRSTEGAMRRAQKEALADTETSTAKDTAPIPLLSAARSLLTASAAELASRSNVTNRGGASRPSQPSPPPTSARPTPRFPMITAAGVTCLFSISTWLNLRSSKSPSIRPALYLSSTAGGWAKNHLFARFFLSFSAACEF